MFASLFAFGLAQSAALVPTLEAMKLAAPKTSPLAAEGAVRLFNVFQDLGQVAGRRHLFHFYTVCVQKILYFFFMLRPHSEKWLLSEC